MQSKVKENEIDKAWERSRDRKCERE